MIWKALRVSTSVTSTNAKVLWCARDMAIGGLRVEGPYHDYEACIKEALACAAEPCAWKVS